jgi:cytochrome c
MSKRSRLLSVVVAAVLLGVVLPGAAVAQQGAPSPPPTPAPAPQPGAPGTYGFGRPATADEIAAVDIDVRPDGAGLPPGSGTAAGGAPIFTQKCSGCHGADGEGTSAAPRLVDATPFQTGVTPPTIGNYWPYATTVWDYIHRAMPFDQPGSLSSDEVYALTAYLLVQNQIIGQDEAMTAESLPKVRMPNVGGFDFPDPRPDVP